jgi:hypothetical protein
VIIKLAPINANFGAPFYDDSNKAFLDDFEGWAKIAPQLSLWCDFYSWIFSDARQWPHKQSSCCV